MANPWEQDEAVASAPWEMDAVADPAANYARRPPQKSAWQLGQEAQSGDPAAIEAYNIRARSLGQPTFEEERAANSPVAGQGFLQNAWQGFGRTLPELARAFDAPQEVDRQRQVDAPLMATGGGTVGGITGQVALTAGPQAALTRGFSAAGVAAPYLAAATVGSGQGALTPVGSGESRLRNTGSAAIWNTGGQVVGDAIGAIGPRVASAVRPKNAELYEQGAKYGIGLTPGQTTGSRYLRYLSSESRNWPLSGANEIADKQQGAFNGVLLRTIGQNGDVITDDALDAARMQNSQMYERALAGQQIKLDQNSWKAYQELRQWMPGRVPVPQIEQFDELMKQYGKDIQGGKITGEIYQQIRQELRDMSAAEKGKYGEALKRFKGVLDDAAERSLPPENLQLYRQADNMYRNRRLIEKGMTRRAGASGDVKPETLWPLVNGKYRSTPEMRDIARFGSNMADTLPQSGTNARMGVSSIADLLLVPPRAAAGRVANSPILARYLVEQPKVIEGSSRLLQQSIPRIAAGTAPFYLQRRQDQKRK